MNTRTLWIGAAALVLAVGCNRTDRQTTSGAPQSGDQARITLTGCLQPGEQGLASREPNAPRSGEDQFVLANAMPPGSPAPSASSTDSSRPLYILEGKTDELRQHVGHQVEITGEPSNSSDPAQVSTRRIEVESVRMIAPSCPSV